MKQQQRRYERTALDCPCRIGERASTARLRELSLGGLRIELESRLGIDRLVAIDIHPPNGQQTIRTDAVVVWCHPATNGGYLAGLRLAELSDIDSDSFETLLAS